MMIAPLLMAGFLTSASEAQAAPPDPVIEAPDLSLASAYLRTIEALDADGYVIDSLGKTWLNRVIVRAHKGHVRREIVVSQSTGLVLRDVIFDDENER